MADPEGFTDQAPHRDQGQPGGRTREKKRPNRFTIPRGAMPARLSSFRLLAMASRHWMLVGSYAQFIRICRWLQLIYKDQLAPLENAPFSTLWARKRYRVAQRFRQY